MSILSKLRQPPEFILLTLGALITRLIWIGWPGQVVFDEVHFGKFLSAYFTHTPFFDIHPPAGKLLYALAAYLGGFQPGFPFANIGEVYSADIPVTVLRLLPAVLGALLVPLVYLIARRLGLTRASATLAAGFVLFDNALLVQSRFMLLDIPLLFFGFGSVYLFLLARERIGRRGAPAYFVASAAALGVALSIKWTALAFCVPLTILFLALLAHRRLGRRAALGLVMLFIVLPALLYAGFFAVHFALTEPAALERLPAEFVELQVRMYTANLQHLTHPYQSAWWQWPWLGRSIYYWVLQPGGVPTHWIYLLGNPFVWWVSLAAVVAGVALLIRELARNTAARLPLLLASAGVVAGLAPFIPIDRALFLYHYFTSLVFGFLLLGALLDATIKQRALRRATVLGLLLCAGIFFLYFAPLSYGTRLTEGEFMERMWLPGWR
ncbi:MAG: phospholipid carrier-dependent glycosyltransferase [bacterium]|nr:phospholipid carrier-dependent glycosyltransferase [bacterium]MDZ4295772.1 phospholipid carrier-dependent glycosyltransferase [Patescibacteria group bacterium]